MSISIHNNTSPENVLQLTNADRAFVNLIQNRLTLNGRIPYLLSELSIIDIIKSGAKFFYKYYGNSWQQSYFHIQWDEIVKYAGTDKFVYLGITIDPRIRVVKQIFETNSSTPYRYTYDDGDKFNTGTVAGSYSVRPELSGINNNLYLIESAVKMVEQRAFDNIFRSKMPFDFVQETHKLILKRSIDNTACSLVLEVLVDIPIQNLYNNTYFERYIIASCKKELKRQIAGHIIPLPGEVVLQAEEICAGWEDVEKVEEYVRQGSGVGDIIMKRK